MILMIDLSGRERKQEKSHKDRKTELLCLSLNAISIINKQVATVSESVSETIYGS